MIKTEYKRILQILFYLTLLEIEVFLFLKEYPELNISIMQQATEKNVLKYCSSNVHVIFACFKII